MNWQDNLIENFKESKNRLLFLDYDGTLVPFFKKPELVKPKPELLKLLKRLKQVPNSELVLISGRDKRTLEKWFSNLKIGLVAEHGAEVKDRNWKKVLSLKTGWKRKIKKVMGDFVKKNPKSFVEEKEFCLVWHYREVSSKIGLTEARRLEKILKNLISSAFQILPGNKIVEVKPKNIDKGKAAKIWLSKKDWNFILAIGDDQTDEQLFRALPKKAWSIRVGLGPSRARNNLKSPSQVISLLKKLLL